MALLKQCSHRGCRKILRDDVKFCDYHQAKFELEEKERYKEYQGRRLKDKEQKKYQQFYNSDNWKKVRDVVVNECLGIDIYEYYTTGRIVQGERVHHIIELNDDWSCRLDMRNLIYLTERNHRNIHVIYEKSNKDKRIMQDKLLKMINKFCKEFII
ncbi:hypothetical protein ACQPUZ_09115 [Clostridium tertium]